MRVREPRYLDHVMIATEPCRYGMLTGTVVAEFKATKDDPVEFAVVLDRPRIDGVCLLVPVPACRLVVLPR